jgi:hypothetical protein
MLEKAQIPSLGESSVPVADRRGAAGQGYGNTAAVDAEPSPARARAPVHARATVRVPVVTSGGRAALAYFLPAFIGPPTPGVGRSGRES